jgi:hypothetical protein
VGAGVSQEAADKDLVSELLHLLKLPEGAKDVVVERTVANIDCKLSKCPPFSGAETKSTDFLLRNCRTFG